MRKYIKVFLNQIFVQMSYKINFLTHIATNVLGVLVALLTWNAIYESISLPTVGHFSKIQMLTYIALTNMSMVLFTTTDVVRLGYFVRNGKLTVHLLRPYSFLAYSFYEYLGSKILYLVLYGSLFLLSFSFYGNLSYPFYQILFLAINLVMFFMFISVVGLLGFWLVQMWPLRPVMTALYMLFAGLLFPLDLLPEPFYNFFSKTPFALVGYHFTLALQNQYTVSELKNYVLLSVLWALCFYLIYKIVFKIGLKKYEGMGV